MLKVLNRGLNFSILPLKLDITQVLVDFRRFERTMIWKEFWKGREEEQKCEPKIFKSRKTNLPKKHKTPNGLKTYLRAVKSDIMDPHNRQQAKCNLPEEEMKALIELVKLQKERKITIKQCDKGAGIMVLDFEEYLKACGEHLEDKQTFEDGTTKKYYKKVSETDLEHAKNKLQIIIDEGYDNEILSKEEYQAMCPEGKKPGKFYCNFKVHKEHEHGKAPPVRPICSGCGSVLENPSAFVQHHIKHVANKHETFILDTPDFLRQVELLNEKEDLPENAFLATIDVKALYTNILYKEGSKCVEEALEERDDKTISTQFIIRLLKHILENNIFEFNEQLYSQEIGAAMGTKPAPDYANIFLARRIDGRIKELTQKYSGKPIYFMKRFLDDIFKIFVGSTKQFHKLFEELNTIHPTIKFTMTHTTNPNEDKESRCSCPPQDSIPFLDTSCKIQNKKIIFDLHRKPTDRNMYLMPSSVHPPHCVQNIPYSLAMRINRICTFSETRELRYQELKDLLLTRGYRGGMVDAAIAKSRAIPRSEALKFVVKQQSTKRPVFVVSWDPRIPSIDAIQQKHWRAMISLDPYLKETFPDPPLVAYKRVKNIRNYVIRSKVPEPNQTRTRRKINGMKKCTKNCPICPFIKETREIKAKKFTWKLNRKITCQSHNIVYMISCQKENCLQNYIGESERKLKDRISEHIGYIRTRNKTQATGYHFNLAGHSLADMKVTALEIVNSTDPMYRKERESYLIRKFNTFYKGMNRLP